ncbi:MAG TPA: toxin TcdB middle/N-terminal domain-containing protein, partial [Polyangia bacterium]
MWCLIPPPLPARRSPDPKFASGVLTRVADVHGNVTEYHYLVHGGQSYLSYVRYNNNASGAFQHQIDFSYETRPDLITSYLATFGVLTAWRATKVEVRTDYGQGTRQLVRRYVLSYEPSRFRSLLKSVQLFGSDGTTSLPALEFSYTGLEHHRDADGVDTAGFVPGFGGLDGTVHTLPQSPPYSIDDLRNELLDIDGDGLPDLFFTDPARLGGRHSYVLNDGGALCASRPDLAEVCATTAALDGLAMARELGLATPSGQITLGNSNVQLLDLDADGRVELLHMPHLTDYTFYRSKCDEPATDGRRRVCHWEPPADGPTPANPDIDLTKDATAIKLLDANGDRRIDVVRTAGTRMETYLNQGQPQRWGFGAAVTSCILEAGGPIDLADPRVKLADMNGDGLTDIVLVRPNAIVYWPNRGPGVWGDGPADCPAGTVGTGRERPITGSPWFLDVSELHLGDVNGDGLADLVRVRADEVDVWLNRGDDSFTDRVIIPGTPFHAGFTNHVRFADLNGTATPDIVWGDGGKYRFMDPAGGERPGLLKRYDNGMGKVVEVAYRPSTAFYLDDRLHNYEWKDRPPFPTPLVYEVTTQDGLGSRDLVTRYHYRDGYYDGVEHEFRGFRYVETWALGDDQGSTTDVHAPTAVTASYFHKGDECVPRGGACAGNDDSGRHLEALKNLPYRVDVYQPAGPTRAEDLAHPAGRVYQSITHTTYALRELYHRVGDGAGTTTQVWQTTTDAVQFSTHGFVAGTATLSLPTYSLQWIDTSTSTAPPEDVPLAGAEYAHVRKTSELDHFGNEVVATDVGRVSESEAITTERTFARNEPLWIHRQVESWVDGAAGLKLKHHKCEHDQLPAGQVGSRGLETKCWNVLYPGETVVQGHETTYTSWGLPAYVKTAGRSEQWLEYSDPSGYATLVSAETERVGEDTDPVSLLTSHADWDPGFGAMVRYRDWNDQATQLVLDPLGRITQVVKPRAPGKEACSEPSVRLSYTVGAPLSRIDTAASEDDCAEGAKLRSITYVDGLGRTRLKLTEGDGPGEWIAQDYVTFDAKG